MPEGCLLLGCCDIHCYVERARSNGEPKLAFPYPIEVGSDRHASSGRGKSSSGKGSCSHDPGVGCKGSQGQHRGRVTVHDDHRLVQSIKQVDLRKEDPAKVTLVGHSPSSQPISES